MLEFILFVLESSGNQHGVLQVHTIDLPLHQLLVKLHRNVQVETELKSMKGMERYSSDVVKQAEALAKKFLLSLCPWNLGSRVAKRFCVSPLRSKALRRQHIQPFVTTWVAIT